MHPLYKRVGQSELTVMVDFSVTAVGSFSHGSDLELSVLDHVKVSVVDK